MQDWSRVGQSGGVGIRLCAVGKVIDEFTTDEHLNSGPCSYMFDIVYVTWIVHLLAALITAKAWYLYLSVRPTIP